MIEKRGSRRTDPETVCELARRGNCNLHISIFTFSHLPHPHTLAHFTLIVSKHQCCFNVIGQRTDLVGIKHILEQRKHTLSAACSACESALPVACSMSLAIACSTHARVGRALSCLVICDQTELKLWL